MDDRASQRSTLREMQTTRSEWESDMRAHRELLRNVIEEHREGRDTAGLGWGGVLDELVLEEQAMYPDVDKLGTSQPPSAAQGVSGWIYHSTSLGCLKPYHFPRRLAIMTVEHPIFDPLILMTIMVNCTTMAWASPLDPPGTWKQSFLGVRTAARPAPPPWGACAPHCAERATLRPAAWGARLRPGTTPLPPSWPPSHLPRCAHVRGRRAGGSTHAGSLSPRPYPIGSQAKCGYVRCVLPSHPWLAPDGA